MSPLPLRQPLPILIGGGGEKVTLELTAQHVTMWNGFGPPETYCHKNQALDNWCCEIGRDPAGVHCLHWRWRSGSPRCLRRCRCDTYHSGNWRTVEFRRRRASGDVSRSVVVVGAQRRCARAAPLRPLLRRCARAAPLRPRSAVAPAPTGMSGISNDAFCTEHTCPGADCRSAGRLWRSAAIIRTNDSPADGCGAAPDSLYPVCARGSTGAGITPGSPSFARRSGIARTRRSSAFPVSVARVHS